MKKITRNRRPLTVDGRQYITSVTAVYPASSGDLTIRVTVRADYGHRSFCIFRGLTNREYYFNYGEYDPQQAISITPRVIADLIRFAHAKGWSPVQTKSNFEVETNNDAIRELMQKVA